MHASGSSGQHWQRVHASKERQRLSGPCYLPGGVALRSARAFSVGRCCLRVFSISISTEVTRPSLMRSLPRTFLYGASSGRSVADMPHT